MMPIFMLSQRPNLSKSADYADYTDGKERRGKSKGLRAKSKGQRAKRQIHFPFLI